MVPSKSLLRIWLGSDTRANVCPCAFRRLGLACANLAHPRLYRSRSIIVGAFLRRFSQAAPLGCGVCFEGALLVWGALLRIQRSGSLASRDGRGRRWANSKQQRRERHCPHCPHCPQCPGGCWNTEDIYPKITKGRFGGLVIFRLKSAGAAVTSLFVAKFTGWASKAGAMPLDRYPSVAVTHTRGGHRGPRG
jgi:hypothetical protein